jgi:hypothetical protein
MGHCTGFLGRWNYPQWRGTRPIVLLRLQDRHLSIGVGLLTERLRGIEEALVVYANGAAQRVVTERSPAQEELFVARDLRTLAEQLGNTVRNP